MNDYVLISSKNDDFGTKYLDLYRKKNDTARFMAKTYWENGKIQSMIFYTNKIKNGPFKMYDIEGNLELEAFYLANKQNGLTIYYKKGEITDFELKFEDRTLTLDSARMREILNLVRK